MLPTAGLPFLTHLLARIAAAGIEHVVLGTSYKAEVFEAHFGDGSKLGLRDRVRHRGPNRWAPAAASATCGQAAPRHRMVFNGDVLSGADLGAAARHPPRPRSRRDAAPGPGAATRAPSAACPPTPTAGSRPFWRRPRIRRPTRSTPAATSSSARSSTGSRAGREVSVEREVFPALLADGRAGLRLRRRHLLARHGHSGRLRSRLGGPGARHRAVAGAERPPRRAAGARRRGGVLRARC